MTLRVPKVLLFDAGNTLVFLDHDALAAAASEVTGDLGGDALRRAEPLAKKSYEAALARGMSHEEGWFLLIRTIFESAGVASADAVEAARLARVAHDAFNLWRKVPAELPAALTRGRKAGLRYGIVSNSEGRLNELLDRVGLLPFFELVVDSALEGVRKPDPVIFARALTRMQANAAETMYAGDIPNVDVDGARAAGLSAVLIDTLDHYPEYMGAPRFPSVAALIAELCP
ncbi:MAG TPA: HAD family hydrolase [Polyangiales bacterium]